MRNVELVHDTLGNRALRYGLAIAAMAVVAVLAPELGRLSSGARFLFSTGALVLAAWFGGLGPGLLATLLIAGVGYYELRQDPGSTPQQAAAMIALFALEGVVIAAAGGLRRRADNLLRRRARQHGAIAQLARWNLGQDDWPRLLQETTQLVLQTLDVERVEIAEIGPEGEGLHVSAVREEQRRAPKPASALPKADRDPENPTATGRAGSFSVTFIEPSRGRATRKIGSAVIMGGHGAFANLEVFGAGRSKLSGGDFEFLNSVANVLTGGLRRRRADAENERLRGRDALLADVTATLGASLDYTTSANALVEGLVPRFADWCRVELLDDSGRLRRFSGAQGDELDPVPDGSAGALVLDESWERPARIALRTGESQLFVNLEDEDLDRITGDPEEAERLRREGLHSLLCVSLRARGRTLGVVTLGARSRNAFDAFHLALAEELAGRAALALDNARLYEKLLADDRAKDEFLAMLGHELRNPLAPMVHSLEVFRVASPDSETRERARQVLERQVTQLRHVVRDLLDVARMTRGTIELCREPVEVGAAVAHALEASQSIIEAHRHVMVTHLSAEPLWIDADPVRFEQILINLINHSVEHSRPETRSELTVEREGEQVSIRIKNNGAGLTSTMLARVFDLYSRGDIMDSGPGTGIGMHLVKRLVELHGGRIEALSAGMGRGSEFIVTLPAMAEVPRPSTVHAPAVHDAEGKFRVLVVDDHMDSAAALAELLTMWGYEARTAMDGRESLRVAESFHPELVLLDLAMPDMNGYQVAAEMRRMTELAGTTIAALTGHALEPNRERAAGFEFDHHWIKPIDGETLRMFVAELAKHRHNAFA